MYIPSQPIQQGPEWANLEANRQAVQSILGALAIIKDTQRQRMEQQQLAGLARIATMPEEQQPTALAELTNPQPQQSVLGRIANPINPWGQYPGPTSVDTAIGKGVLGQMLESPTVRALREAQIGYYKDRGTALSQPKPISETERAYKESQTSVNNARAGNISALTDSTKQLNDTKMEVNRVRSKKLQQQVDEWNRLTDEQKSAKYDKDRAQVEKMLQGIEWWNGLSDEEKDLYMFKKPPETIVATSAAQQKLTELNVENKRLKNQLLNETIPLKKQQLETQIKKNQAEIDLYSGMTNPSPDQSSAPSPASAPTPAGASPIQKNLPGDPTMNMVQPSSTQSNADSRKILDWVDSAKNQIDQGIPINKITVPPYIPPEVAQRLNQYSRSRK